MIALCTVFSTPFEACIGDYPRNALAVESSRSAELDRWHQGRGLHPQCLGKGLDCLQPHRSLPTFNQADVGPVKLSGVRQRFLAQFQRLSMLPDDCTELFGKRCLPHLDSVPGL